MVEFQAKLGICFQALEFSKLTLQGSLKANSGEPGDVSHREELSPPHTEDHEDQLGNWASRGWMSSSWTDTAYTGQGLRRGEVL